MEENIECKILTKCAFLESEEEKSTTREPVSPSAPASTDNKGEKN